jgi:hypothetical protein
VKIVIKKPGRIFFFSFMFLLFLPNYRGLAGSNILGEMKEHFKTGVLRDFTPKIVSPNFVNVRPEGPFLMVVGIARETYMADIRHEAQREKITFKLVKGSGKFASVRDSQDRSGGKYIIAPDEDGSAAVLFYPSVGFFSSKECQIKVFVENLNSTNITGELVYKLHSISIDKTIFEKVSSGYKDLAMGPLVAPRIEMRHSKNYFHDKFGREKDREEEEDSIATFKEDGSVETLFGNGKTSVSKPSGHHSQPIENAWGVDQEHVIYFRSSPRKSKVISGSCSFIVLNKINCYFESVVVVGDGMLSLLNFSYANEKGVLYKKSTELTQTTLSGIKLMERDTESTLK